MKIFNFQFSIPASRRRNAQAVLSVILLIGGIIVLIALALAFFATSFVNSVYGFQASQRAQAVAAAGVYNALQMLTRNTGLTMSSTSVPIGNDTATVTVTQNSPASGQATIVSAATVSSRQRTFQVVISIASSTNQSKIISWR